MQRSSETIGAIAAALAKAQAELTNPEKALIATIRASNPRDQDQTFRYAPLSSGLDIVRKTLGGQEIATVQTTAIDKEAGLIRLTTTLAHSSGEWLSSEWPVCAITETAAPRRMGAALTYARRYALFTLVGIAGEDDLDAPDLNARIEAAPKAEPGSSVGASAQSAAPRDGISERPLADSAFGRREKPIRPARVTLNADQSATLREQLLADVTQIQSSDEAADWVHRNLPAKNTLVAEDAHLVEASFSNRLATIESSVSETLSAQRGHPSEAIAASTASLERGAPFDTSTADSAETSIVLLGSTPPRRRRVVAKTIRLRDKEHCKFVATQPCVVCGRMPSEAHHIRFAQPRALGRKVSDEYMVPVCRLHHRELHRYGDEASWWAGVNVDPLPIALELWRRSRPSGAHAIAVLSSLTAPATNPDNAEQHQIGVEMQS
jgi:hypothetical protein